MGKLSVLKTPIGITLILVLVGTAAIVGYYMSPWFKGFIDGVTPSTAAAVDWMVANSLGPVSYLGIFFLTSSILCIVMGVGIERQISKAARNRYLTDVGVSPGSSGSGQYRSPNPPPDAKRPTEAPPQ